MLKTLRRRGDKNVKFTLHSEGYHTLRGMSSELYIFLKYFFEGYLSPTLCFSAYPVSMRVNAPSPVMLQAVPKLS